MTEFDAVDGSPSVIADPTDAREEQSKPHRNREKSAREIFRLSDIAVRRRPSKLAVTPDLGERLPRNSRDSTPALTVRGVFPQRSVPLSALYPESDELEDLNGKRRALG
jgi:hypothetical protein